MKVSVITTLYNYSHYIVDAISSFLDQDFNDSEMIIVDDGSTDNPHKVIEKYLSTRIRYIRIRKNKGYSHAKNIGIRRSSSEILVMLDADDMLTPGSISTRYHKLKKGYDFVHGPVMNYKDRKKSPSPLWKQWLKSCKYKNVHAQSVMLRKEIHRKIGLYDESLWCKSDREMWARIFHHGFRIGFVNEYVALYRIHKRQMSRSKAKLRINSELQKQVLDKIERRKTDLLGVDLL